MNFKNHKDKIFYQLLTHVSHLINDYSIKIEYQIID